MLFSAAWLVAEVEAAEIAEIERMVGTDGRESCVHIVVACKGIAYTAFAVVLETFVATWDSYTALNTAEEKRID